MWCRRPILDLALSGGGSVVGDCRRNLVGRCAGSSLVCPGREARNQFLFALSDNGGGRPRYLASNGTRLVGTDLQVEVSGVDARQKNRERASLLDAT